MKKKWLITTLVSITLATGLNTAISNQHIVQAAPAHSYSWWTLRPRKVRVTKRHRIYEIQAVIPRYKSYEIRSKVLKKDSIVRINHGWSYLWIVKGKGLKSNYSKGDGRFWTTNGSKGWYSLKLRSKKKSHVSTSLRKKNNYQPRKRSS